MTIYNGTITSNYIVGSEEDDEIYGLAGADNLRGGLGNDIIDGGDGDDYLLGEDGVDTIYGGLGNDNLLGGTGNDVLNGDGGIDWFIGGDGADSIDGGTDKDTVVYSDEIVGITIYLDGTACIGGTAEGDTIINVESVITSDYDDFIYGNSLSNYIIAVAGKDTVYGYEGNDYIIGGIGADTIDGGIGIDTAGYLDSSERVIVYLDGTAGAGGEASGDVLSNIENIIGSNFNDRLYGNSEANRINGGEGDDIIEGGDGADRIIGGTGTDTLSYELSDSGVTVFLNYDGGLGLGYALGYQDGGDGGHGAGDIISEIENLIGSLHNDYLAGDDNVNNISGREGDDWIRGGAGADIMEGGLGIDALLYDNSDTGVTAYISGSGSTGGHAEGDVNSGFEIMYGSIYSDTLYGSINGESIMGNAGDDTINADDGNDIIYGGYGNDTINGGDGDDWMRGGAGADVITGGLGENDIAVYSDSDAAVTISLVDGSVGSGGYAEGDIINSTEDIIGSNYDDMLQGNNSANIIDGDNGVDTVDYSDAESNAVEIYPDPVGNPTYFYTQTYGIYIDLDGVVSYNSNYSQACVGDQLLNVENIIGSESNDVIYGNDSDNYINSGAGNDNLDGRAGADTINGGGGTDYINYIYSPSAVTVYLDGTTSSGGDAQGDIITNIENIKGSDYDDALYGNASNNYIMGRAGADIIDGGAGIDFADYYSADSGVTVYLDGTVCTGSEAEGDTIYNTENIRGSAYDDNLYGDAGDNYIMGRSGADIIDGGLGTDTASYHSSGSGVTVYLNGMVCSGGEAEGDTIYNTENIRGSNSNDNLYGNAEGNYFFGRSGNDNIYGGDGNDSLEGSVGADYLDGGNALDTALYITSTSGVTVYLDGTVCSGGDAEGDIIVNVEHVSASNYDDTIYGSSEDNALYGGGGNDLINGGEGADTIEGGSGSDYFVYMSATETVATAYDTVSDFMQGTDILVFEDSIFGSDWTAFNTDISSGTQTVITHSSLIDFELHLSGTYTLTSADFSFV